MMKIKDISPIGAGTKVRIIDDEGGIWQGTVIMRAVEELGDEETCLTIETDDRNFIGFYDGDIKSIEILN